MKDNIPSTVFLAGSTVELISALACIAGLRIPRAAVFVERNISFKTAAMDPLLEAARARFPTVQIVELALYRPEPARKDTGGLESFLGRWRLARSLHRQLDEACRVHFQRDLKSLGQNLERVGFTTVLHDYVTVFLTACGSAERMLYPHGFDHPRRQFVRDYDFEVCRRSLRTMIATLPRQKKYLALGEVMLGAFGFLVPGITTVSLPFTGVDRVLTFRSDIDYVPNTLVQVGGLADIFRWLLTVEPWKRMLQERIARVKHPSVLLLLPEFNTHPIWEKNRNFGAAQLELLRKVEQLMGLGRVVIKAHVRSDGSAANWLAEFLEKAGTRWEIEILPSALSGLPVEALALNGEFSAACSLGSCSLPPGLGFGIPHYVSPDTSALFDAGWQGHAPSNCSAGSRMLIAENICRNVDLKLKAPLAASAEEIGGG